MPEHSKGNPNDDGVLGIDAMSGGIWKIDFKKEELTFASSVDSIEQTGEAEIFPTTFSEHAITIEVRFGNNVETMAVDLGYNGDLLLPLNEFKKFALPNKTLFNVAKFNTPTSQNVVNNLSIIDTINISHNWFSAIISSNELVKEKLIGLAFFRRFDYVIFDFVNKRIYTPRKVW